MGEWSNFADSGEKIWNYRKQLTTIDSMQNVEYTNPIQLKLSVALSSFNFVFFLVINLAKVSQTTKQISEEIFEPPKKL